MFPVLSKCSIVLSDSQVLSVFLLSYYQRLDCCVKEVCWPGAFCIPLSCSAQWSFMSCADENLGFFQLVSLHLFFLPLFFLCLAHAKEQVRCLQLITMREAGLCRTPSC